MEIEARQQIREQMKDLNDRALLRLLALEGDDYLPEALTIAKEEAELRNLKTLAAKEYHAQYPEEVQESGFCSRCLDQSYEETPGPMSIFGFGTRLLPAKDECEICHSRVEDLWWCFASPIRRIARYRVSFDDPSHYRRIKGEGTDAEPAVDDAKSVNV